MAENILDRLAQKARVGQDSFAPRIPTIKLDGSGSGETAGHILKFANDAMEDLGNSLNIQIIRVRKKLMLGGEDTKFFSDEYDSSTHDKIKLKRCVKEGGTWGKPEVVAEGTASEIRAVQPVKVVSIVYAIIAGELIKLTVKGASTTGEDGLYEYLDSFKPLNVFQFETNVSVSLVQKNRAISYHRMHFKRGAEITKGFEQVESYLDIIKGVTAEVVSTTTEDGEAW